MGISLSHRGYEEIKRIVVDLFVKYDVTCVPVNGFELATKMGIKVVIQFDRYIKSSDKEIVVFMVIAPDFTKQSVQECVDYSLNNDTWRQIIKIK